MRANPDINLKSQIPDLASSSAKQNRSLDAVIAPGDQEKKPSLFSDIKGKLEMPSLSIDTVGNFDLSESATSLLPKLREKLNQLRQQGLIIQAHPLGFLKIPLGLNQKRNEDGQYLHVWKPGLPTQAGGPYIHTHAFKMDSKLLSLNGNFSDLTWQETEDPKGNFAIVSAIPAEMHSSFDKTIRYANLTLTNECELKPNIVYHVPLNCFHSSKTEGEALTLVNKYDYTAAAPLLAVPRGEEIGKANFDHSQLNQEWAWAIVEEMLSFAV